MKRTNKNRLLPLQHGWVKSVPSSGFKRERKCGELHILTCHWWLAWSLFFPCEINPRSAQVSLAAHFPLGFWSVSGAAGSLATLSSIVRHNTFSVGLISLFEQLCGDSEAKRQIIGQWNWVLCGIKLKKKFLPYELGSEKKTQQTEPFGTANEAKERFIGSPAVGEPEGHWPESSGVVLPMPCCYQVETYLQNYNLLFPLPAYSG